MKLGKDLIKKDLKNVNMKKCSGETRSSLPRWR